MKNRHQAPGPYVVACGRCNRALDHHPHRYCEYDYRPTRYGRKIVGYSMTRIRG